MRKRIGIRQDKAGRWRDDSGHYASAPPPKLDRSGRYRFPNGKYVPKESLSPAQKASQTRRVREYAAQLEAERKAEARRTARKQKKTPTKAKAVKGKAVQIYEAGDKENHAEEKEDAAFDTVKFLNGSKGNPQSNQMKRAKRSRHRAEMILAPYLGKTITVKLRLRVYDEGMLRSRMRTVSRTFSYTQYKDFLDAVTDTIKTTTKRPGGGTISTENGSARAVLSGDIAVILPDGTGKRRLRPTGTTTKSKQKHTKKMGSGGKNLQSGASKRRDHKKGGRVR